MTKEKYSWENLIFNPTTDEAKNAVGKEVYYSDAPLNCIDYADKDNTEFLGVLDSVSESNAPFYIRGIGNWNCIIVKKEPCYKDQVKQWVEENNLKVGDYVKVLRKTEPYENKWRNFWVDEMSDYIGKALKVLAINSLRGLISLECDDAVYDFPYFVLEKTEPPKPKYVPFESKEEFIDAFHYHDNANYSETEDILMNYGMWLKDKNSHEIFLVTGVFNQSIHICDFDSDESWGELLNEFTFIDGSPCGKLAEENK